MRMLSLAEAEFDALITADKGMEYQQNQTLLPVAILILVARSNRLADIAPLVPAVLQALDKLKPRTLSKVSA